MVYNANEDIPVGISSFIDYNWGLKEVLFYGFL